MPSFPIIFKKSQNNKIALGSNLVQQFFTVFPVQSKKPHFLSCLLFYEPGKTETDRSLANQIVPTKAAKTENRPDRYSF